MPFIKGQDAELLFKSCVWLSSLFLLMVSEINLDLGCRINVAFGSVLQSDSLSIYLCCWHWQGWMKHGFYCYSVGKLPATFSEAKQICEANKGYLTTVTDRYENVILVLSYVQPEWKHHREISLQLFIASSVKLLCWKIYRRTEVALKNTSGTCMSLIQIHKPLLLHTYTVSYSTN